MKIADKSIVTLEYSLHLGDGVIVDRGGPDDPLTYLHGTGQIVPGLEQALTGLEPEQATKVVVSPNDGYGVRDEAQVQTLPRIAFGDQPIKAGDELIATDDSENEVALKVVRIDGDKVTVDFNHPLAGATLHFDVVIQQVRAATEEELSHGHAHDGDGHHH
jgi:FKBP-type peptidyl-prolyl cis-trans isomerase SlyD